MPEQRPNFLLIMAEHVSGLADPNAVEGFPVRMPALRRLADTSVHFENAYCNSPVCGPSRMSFLTGRYVCNHGAYDNGSALPWHVPTFAHLLTANGYHTVMCGRMHYHGLDLLKGFGQRLVNEIHSPLLANPADFPGPLDPIRPLTPDAPRRPRQQWSDSSLFDHDAHVTRTACDFLRTRPEGADERPFCMTVGYLVAHPSASPMPALKPLYEDYLLQDLPIAQFTPDDYERLPEHIKRLHQLLNHDESIFSEQVQRHQMASYLARMTYLDQQLGQVLDALDDSGLADDTVVVFLSDHGDGMGRHGLWGKMFFYEEAERIPCYVRVPGMRMGRAVAERVSTVDILPTLAGLADRDVPFPVDGRNLLPLLAESRSEEGGRAVFSEYHGYLSPSDMYMVIKGDHKYCHYLLEPGELYNLVEDPVEEHNLIDRPESQGVTAELEAGLRAHVNPEQLAESIREYNAQRQACCDAITASEGLQRFNQDYIAWHRARLNDPWYDGGRYCAKWEPHLYSKTGFPFDGEPGQL